MIDKGESILDFFIGNQYYGRSIVSETPCSLAFFCRSCGDIWARIVSTDAATRVINTWQVRQVPCKNHTPVGVEDWETCPGSVLNNFVRWEFVGMLSKANCIEALSREMLVYEFELAIKAAETFTEREV